MAANKSIWLYCISALIREHIQSRSWLTLWHTAGTAPTPVEETQRRDNEQVEIREREMETEKHREQCQAHWDWVDATSHNIVYQSTHVCADWCPLTALLKFPCTSPSAYSSALKLRLNSISSSLDRPAVRAWYFSTMDQRECSKINKRTSLRERGGGVVGGYKGGDSSV